MLFSNILYPIVAFCGVASSAFASPVAQPVAVQAPGIKSRQISSVLGVLQDLQSKVNPIVQQMSQVADANGDPTQLINQLGGVLGDATGTLGGLSALPSLSLPIPLPTSLSLPIPLPTLSLPIPLPTISLPIPLPTITLPIPLPTPTSSTPSLPLPTGIPIDEVSQILSLVLDILASIFAGLSQFPLGSLSGLPLDSLLSGFLSTITSLIPGIGPLIASGLSANNLLGFLPLLGLGSVTSVLGLGGLLGGLGL